MPSTTDTIWKDLSVCLDSKEVWDLVQQFEYPPDIRERKTQQIIAEYRNHPDQPILGVEMGGELVGLIGLLLTANAEGVIRHIVVRRERRGHHIGRKMIEAVIRQYALRSIAAETDRDAVGFYRACGFEIRSLGMKYPGVERFVCERIEPV